MRMAILIAVMLAFATSSAEARKKKHRHHARHVIIYSTLVGPSALAMQNRDAPRKYEQRRGSAGYERAADLVPADWQVQPSDSNWKGQRFTSPDGAAWFAIYATQADPKRIADHLKSVAFLDGEEVTYIRGEQDWLAVYGVKDNRIFYRKVVLACAGRSWHHIAFEYPEELKGRMAKFVSRATLAIDAAEDDGCDEGSAGVASAPATNGESRGRDRRGTYDQESGASWRSSKGDSGKRWQEQRADGLEGLKARDYKEEYRDGRCKVERKWESNGEFKEEVKCKGGR